MFLISPITVVVHAVNIQDRDRGQIGGCRSDGVFALKALIRADRATVSVTPARHHPFPLHAKRLPHILDARTPRQLPVPRNVPRHGFLRQTPPPPLDPRAAAQEHPAHGRLQHRGRRFRHPRLDVDPQGPGRRIQELLAALPSVKARRDVAHNVDPHRRTQARYSKRTASILNCQDLTPIPPLGYGVAGTFSLSGSTKTNVPGRTKRESVRPTASLSASCHRRYEVTGEG